MINNNVNKWFNMFNTIILNRESANNSNMIYFNIIEIDVISKRDEYFF